MKNSLIFSANASTIFDRSNDSLAIQFLSRIFIMYMVAKFLSKQCTN